MHILLLTYDISPYRGSEASVSWNYVVNMSSYHHITVLYGHGKDEIDKFNRSNNINNVEFVNIPCLSFSDKWLIGDIQYNLNYKKWQKKAFFVAKSIISKSKVDIIHYLNPIGFKEPGYLWKIDNIPYVWGPVQCVENRPFHLYKAMSLKGKLTSLFRFIFHNGWLICSPRVRKAFKRADTIFAATPNTRKELLKWHNKESIYLPENGIMQMDSSTPIDYHAGEQLRLIWIGAINERKALSILLSSLRYVKSENWILDVIGDGPLRKNLQICYSDLKKNICWHGKVERSEVQRLFKTAHLHIISSLGEGNPTTIWEAMSKGVPTMTLDHCGMSGVVCGRCGIKIPITSYEQVLSDIAFHIDNIIDNPYIIQHLSSGVIACSDKFMWKNRIKIYNDTYSNLIDKYNEHS